MIREQENKIKKAFHILSVCVSVCMYVFFFLVCSFVDGLEYARSNASPTVNDVTSNKLGCRTFISAAYFVLGSPSVAFTPTVKVIRNNRATKRKLIDRLIFLSFQSLSLNDENELKASHNSIITNAMQSINI